MRFACLSLLTVFAINAITETRAAETRPNLIVIVADDMRADFMGCAGHQQVKTPQLDQLAADGVRFRNMFVTTAICAASRASILTGLYERTHRYTFDTKPITAQHWATSYPAQLKQAGYRTGYVGKFGVEVEGDAVATTYDQFSPLNRTPYWKTQADGTKKHLTDIEGDTAIKFVESCRPDQPFCLSLCFNAPHAEDADPQQYFWTHASDDLYRETVFPVPKTMAPEFFERLPKFLQESESRVRFQWRFDEPDKYQSMVRGYFRMISDVDRVVGRLRNTLDKQGLSQQTVILFTADNGYFLGERGFADKWYIYEHSIRVPLIIYDPRTPTAQRNKIVSQTCLNVDLAPTLLDLAGISKPSIYQGHSLRTWLNQQGPANWRTDFFYEHLFERNNIPKSEGVRNARFTYVRWFEQQPLVEELYDHQADYEQEHNLISDPRFAETVKELRARTTELRDLYGGPFVSNARRPKVQK